jgi:hypothetical protein
MKPPSACAKLRRASAAGGPFASPARLVGRPLLARLTPAKKIISRKDWRIIKGFTLVNIRNRDNIPLRPTPPPPRPNRATPCGKQNPSLLQLAP